jgi:hypothetical protein
MMPRVRPWRALGTAALVAAGLVAAPLMLEARIAKSEQEPDDSWETLPARRRGSTLLGVSFRPLQAEAFHLDPRSVLTELLDLPFQMIRLGAYWSRIEPAPGEFDLSELEWQIQAAERAGKQIVLSVGAVKNFGYPEFFVPEHRLSERLAEGSLIYPATHPGLLSAATQFIRQIVERYRGRDSVVAWQVEHEAVDPRGMESSWRLATQFVQAELAAVKEADPGRPVMMNGFLPTSSPVRLQQGWRTRDQGDSLAVAARLADIVGIDYYPRHALLALGPRTVYLTGGRLPWQRALAKRFVADVYRRGKWVMVSEGQAEPWEAFTVPPSPGRRAMFSCSPADLIRNYNTAMDWTGQDNLLYAYLFWGAEYWLLRRDAGDASYLDAFMRVLKAS